jgi:predicted glycoside hydrolase/deacetylase ChbG (UPF0249 family)
MARLILCADDFALSRPISETIATLARAGKVNAVSCMAVCPGWAEDAALLSDLRPGVQVGLRLVLTGEVPLPPCPVLAPAGRMQNINDRLRARGHQQRLSRTEIKRRPRAPSA